MSAPLSSPCDRHIVPYVLPPAAVAILSTKRPAEDGFLSQEETPKKLKPNDADATDPSSSPEAANAVETVAPSLNTDGPVDRSTSPASNAATGSTITGPEPCTCKAEDPRDRKCGWFRDHAYRDKLHKPGVCIFCQEVSQDLYPEIGRSCSSCQADFASKIRPGIDSFLVPQFLNTVESYMKVAKRFDTALISAPACLQESRCFICHTNRSPVNKPGFICSECEEAQVLPHETFFKCAQQYILNLHLHLYPMGFNPVFLPIASRDYVGPKYYQEYVQILYSTPDRTNVDLIYLRKQSIPDVFQAIREGKSAQEAIGHHTYDTLEDLSDEEAFRVFLLEADVSVNEVIVGIIWLDGTTTAPAAPAALTAPDAPPAPAVPTVSDTPATPLPRPLHKDDYLQLTCHTGTPDSLQVHFVPMDSMRDFFHLWKLSEFDNSLETLALFDADNDAFATYKRLLALPGVIRLHPGMTLAIPISLSFHLIAP